MAAADPSTAAAAAQAQAPTARRFADRTGGALGGGFARFAAGGGCGGGFAGFAATAGSFAGFVAVEAASTFARFAGRSAPEPAGRLPPWPGGGWLGGWVAGRLGGRLGGRLPRIARRSIPTPPLYSECLGSPARKPSSCS